MSVVHGLGWIWSGQPAGYRSAQRGAAKLNSRSTAASIAIGTGRIRIPAIVSGHGDTGKSRAVRQARQST